MKWLLARILPAFVIAGLFIGACSALPQIAPTAILKPTAMPALSVTLVTDATPSAVLQSDDVWDRITANKKIVVGTSWDYPPFAYIDPSLQAVGLDLALIKEIGHRLKIPIDIQNFSFDALPSALQTNQIDLAIAAISVTPERASQMSFSQVYYVNDTAVLARNDSTLMNITSLNQLAGQRVGVQKGSTYEDLAKSSLVDSGLIHADQLISYAKSDEAIQGLVANKVDLLITGLAPANYYSSHQGLKVVGKGFNKQNLAVAMRSGTPRLKAEIDRVLTDMLNDGTMSGLIQEYIQNDNSDVAPTPSLNNPLTATPVPPTSTAIPVACLDAMKFISDVTFSDNNMKNPPYVAPGAGFVKTWRVQNTGTCTWTNYRLVYAYGNLEAAQMSGQPVNIPGSILPGQTVGLSVTLIAPAAPFVYQGFWQLENARGIRFGQAIWVTISTSTTSSTQFPGSTVQPGGESCVVKLTSPNGPIKVRSDFDAVWTVQNTSGKTWFADSVDYEYVSGAKLQKQDAYDIGADIADGKSVKFIVDMTAPKKPGIYTAKWIIHSAGKTLCTMNLFVTVNPK